MHTEICNDDATPERASLRLGRSLDSKAVASIERTLHLTLNKWDTQVGDNSVLSSQPLIISRQSWTTLQRIAEQLAAELQSRELQIFENHQPQEYIGLPRTIREVLAKWRPTCLFNR
jgi:hypothetical protein